MSLLLDALRRAAASKQEGPEADQYTAPRRGDPGYEVDAGARSGAEDEDASLAPAGSEAGGSDESRGEPADELELSLEPEIDTDASGIDRGASETGTGERESDADRASGRSSGPPGRTGSPSRPAATALLSARSSRRRRGRGVLLALVGTLVVLAALGAGGWWYYQQSRQAVEEGLAGFQPTADPLVQLPSEAGADDAAIEAGGDPAIGERPAADQDGEAGVPEADRDGTGAEDREGTDADEATAGEAVPLADDDNAEQQVAAADTASTSDSGEDAGSASGGSGTASGAETSDATAESGATRTADTSETTDTADATETTDTTGTSDTSRSTDDTTSTRTAQPLVRRGDASPIARALEDGYAALRAGNLDAATRAYAEAVRRAPDNRDALLGLATIAERRGQPERAVELYRRILSDRPRDPYARTRVAALSGNSQPRRSETELKQLLNEQPDSPSLQFALGNVYAAESRWSEAQRAFFEAYSAESDNAEYVYNLAVALDHLEQRTAALKYYREALARAGTSTAGFSTEAVRRRIEQLE